MSVINTNYLSLVAQNNLQKSQSALGNAIERLSSGLRINSAKDDAAGQAIANRMTAQVKGLNQAQRNANDGISVAQTAEGALNQVNDNLQRIRELTVQSRNDTNSAEDRKSIQAEINQRLTEINRISEQTDFNGTKVLSKDQALEIQVGANDSETIEIKLEEITASKLGLGTFNVSGPGTGLATAGAADFQKVYGDTTAVTTSVVADFSADLKTNLGFTGTVTVATTASVDDDNNWFAKVDITATTAAEVQVLASQGIEVELNTLKSFYVALDPNSQSTTTAGTDATFNVNGANLRPADLTTGVTGDPLSKVDEALKKVDTLRSDLGAIQNRFESAITNLQTNSTNLQAARSRIEDADYAVEVANMSKNQILQQAGTSVLAQANQIPQGVLSLLR